MNKNILIALGVVIIAVLGGAFALMNSQSDENTAVETLTPTTDLTTQATINPLESDTVNVTVESNGLSFTPSTIKVKNGQTVNVTYKNNMGRHDFVLDEFNASTELINAGQEETITFVADKTGTFEFYCSVAGHRESGMKGSFIVE